MKPHRINELDDFICGWYLDDPGICDRLIAYHQNHPAKSAGTVGTKQSSQALDKGAKDSIDVSLTGDLFVEYNRVLVNVVPKYIERFPMCNHYSPWGVREGINVQYYQPGGAYFAWHTERTSSLGANATRHLVFMTYLNDVADGGETEFLHQELKVQAERGLTLIWPADWTFTHRGVVSPTQEKYIVTGWLNYFNE